MQETGWMDSLAVSLDLSLWYREKNMDKPFRLDGFACVTDGHFLVAVASDKEILELKDEKSVTALRGYLATPLSGPEYDAEHLKQWCYRPEPPCTKCSGTRKTRCGECHGSGQTQCVCECGDLSHEVTCDDCDGEKTVDCDCVISSIPARVFGQVINILLLHKALEHLSGTFQACSQDESKPLIIGNAEWRVVVMGMLHQDPKETYTPAPAQQPQETVVAG